MKEFRQILIIAAGTCLGQIFVLITIVLFWFVIGASLVGGLFGSGIQFTQ